MSSDPFIRDHKTWLGFVQQEGLVVSPAALVDAQVILEHNVLPLQERYREFVQAHPSALEELRVIRHFPTFVRDFLGWPEECLFGIHPSRPLSDEFSIHLPDYGETLTASFAFKDPRPKDPAKPWLMLVQEVPVGTDLDARATGSDQVWSASATQRLERLLRDAQVPIGLLFNGTQIRPLYAPPGENSGNITFHVRHMEEVAGRPILAAFHMLLGECCGGALPTASRLPAILERSRAYQSNVSTKLAAQVLDSLYELLRGFQAANERARGELLRKVIETNPDNIYAGLLTVLMRLVFLLFAEDRLLVPTDPKTKQPTEVFTLHYSIHGLFKRLHADAELYPDTMDQRYGAWSQLLALFKGVYQGCPHPQMKMPARKGHLFEPDRFPFLQGRATRSDAQGSIPLVSDGTLYRVLRNLLILDGERLSYQTLDVQEIGSVYQTIMGFAVEVCKGTSVALKGKSKHGGVPAATVISLDSLLAEKPADRAKILKELAETELTGDAQKRLKEAQSVDDLLAALEKRIDRQSTPHPIPSGGLVLQPTDERRRSGSHYTPRSFTEPIVRKTLKPILEKLGAQPTSDQILDLKVCDIAVGSAAFLVETCRQLGEALVQAWRAHGGRPEIPDDETVDLLAMRMVAQRCLYGVDRNPMAVDLAKLSLWLVTLAKDHPFTFVDHAIRCGDSLVGLKKWQIEDFTWKNERPLQRGLFEKEVENRVNEALGQRRALLSVNEDYDSPLMKQQKLEAADEKLDLVREIGNATLAAFFLETKDKARESKRSELAQRFVSYLQTQYFSKRPTADIETLKSGPFPIQPFHWEIEFPEVFDEFNRKNPGFDAIIGNPPFAGKNTLIHGNRAGYLDWLQTLHDEAHGASDLAAHFFRRAFDLIRKNGTLGLIATNTIFQGDTRHSGLRWICVQGGTIYSANKRYKWPGQAAVVISIVWVCKGNGGGLYDLDGRFVPLITAYLFHAGGHESPSKLISNARRSFKGSVILGLGFTFDDTENKANANRLSEMNKLIEHDPHNSERIFPYIGGDEVNDSPTHAHHRYVIGFGDMSLAEASRWPDLLKIVRERVKPGRDVDKRDGRRNYWWRFGETTPALYAATKLLKRVMVIVQTSKYRTVTFLKPDMIYDQKLVVFASADYTFFSVIHSRVHENWALFFGSSMKDDPVYAPSDCFETFPFPNDYEENAKLERMGQEYYEYRAALMVTNNEGLTKTYNRFHDPNETSPAVLRLRELHTQMDSVVLAAYGWTDIPTTCEFILNYDDEDPDDLDNAAPSRRKKPWRYRWPDSVRDEVLARLLRLNEERAQEERLAGAAAASAATKKPAKTKTRKPKVIEASAELDFAGKQKSQLRELPKSPRSVDSDPLVYPMSLLVGLLSLAGGKLSYRRLLNAFVFGSRPKIALSVVPHGEETKLLSKWAAIWNEKLPSGALWTAAQELRSQLAMSEDKEIELRDGPRSDVPEHIAFDAWVGLQLTESGFEIESKDELDEPTFEQISQLLGV